MVTPINGSFSESPRASAKNALKIHKEFGDSKNTIFYDSAGTGNIPALKFLYENSCFPNVKIPERQNQTALFGAVIGNHYEAVQFLLEKRALVNITDDDGNTPLFYAANAASEIAMLLLDHGAEIGEDVRILKESLKLKNYHVARLLLNRKSKVDEECLILTLKQGKIKLADKEKKRLENFYDLCPKLMNELVNLGCIKGVKWLLKKGADPNIDFEGKKCLHIAAAKGFSKITQHLVYSRADVNAVEFKDSMPHRTPLEIAAEKGKKKVAKVLLENCAEVDLCTTNGCTPLYLATQKGHYELAKILIQYDADINYRNNAGNTILYKLTTSSKTHFRANDFLKKRGATTGSQKRRSPRPKSMQLKSPHIIHTFTFGERKEL